MRITGAWAGAVAITFASLVAGVVVAPPLHLGPLGVDVAYAKTAPVDGGGAVDLSLPWDQPVAPANTTPLGPPQILLPGGTSTLAGLGTDVSSGGVPAVFVSGTSGIPSNVLAAYQRAAGSMAATDPSCHLSWPVLAAIGKVESGHARGGALDASGRTLSPILGPVLSGGPYAAIRDTDGGRWDGDKVWDRAVGPMQFIPSSWRAHGVDGNGDGVADPSNIFDATLSAAGYLCTGGRDLSKPAELRAAIFGYNHSSAYVNTVLAWATVYAAGVQGTIPSSTGGVVLASGSSSAPRTTPPPQTPTPTPSRTPSKTPTPTASPTPSQVPSVTPTPTPTPTPTNTSTPTGTTCPTATPTSTGTGSPTDTPTPTPTPTPTGTDPSASPSPTDDPCATPTPTPTSADAQVPSPTPTP